MRTRSAVLVGRTAELAALTPWLPEPGAGGARFCVGAPRVGKSRLVAEAAARAAASGLVVVHGRASRIGPVSPLRPFAEALAALQRRGLLPEDDLGGYRPLLGRVVPQVPGPGWLGIGEPVPAVAFAEAMLRVLATFGDPAGRLLRRTHRRKRHRTGQTRRHHLPPRRPTHTTARTHHAPEALAAIARIIGGDSAWCSS